MQAGGGGPSRRVTTMGRPGDRRSVLNHLDGHRVTLTDPHPHSTPRLRGGRRDQSKRQHGATRTSTAEPRGRTIPSRAPRDSTYSSSGRALPSSSTSSSFFSSSSSSSTTLVRKLSETELRVSYVSALSETHRWKRTIDQPERVRRTSWRFSAEH